MPGAIPAPPVRAGCPGGRLVRERWRGVVVGGWWSEGVDLELEGVDGGLGVDAGLRAGHSVHVGRGVGTIAADFGFSGGDFG